MALFRHPWKEDLDDRYVNWQDHARARAGAGDLPASWVTVILGGACWILATLQYAVVQVVAAAAWHHPPYSWLGNYISDLGNTACGPFKVPHGTGLGKVVVGLVPENINIDLHTLAAFNVPVGCVAILLLSLPRRQASRALSAAGIVLAVIGLAATVLSTAAEFASKSSLDLGLRAGGMERLADYPGGLWILLIGIVSVLSAGARAGHPAAPRSR